LTSRLLLERLGLVRVAAGFLKSQNGFIQVIVLLLIAVVAYVLITGNGKDLLSKVGINVGNQASRSASYPPNVEVKINQPVGGTTYTNPEKVFSVSFPAGWILTSTFRTDYVEAKSTTKQYNFSGPQKESLSISFTNGGYGGGGCPDNSYIDVKLKSESAKGCVESSSISSLAVNRGQTVIYFGADYSAQTKQGILDILSTVSIIGEPKYSSSGLLIE
jgi:hypothetical protein